MHFFDLSEKLFRSPQFEPQNQRERTRPFSPLFCEKKVFFLSVLLVFLTKTGAIRGVRERERVRRQRILCSIFFDRKDIGGERIRLSFGPKTALETRKREKKIKGKFKFEHTSYFVCCASSNGYRFNSATTESLGSIFVET